MDFWLNRQIENISATMKKIFWYFYGLFLLVFILTLRVKGFLVAPLLLGRRSLEVHGPEVLAGLHLLLHNSRQRVNCCLGTSGLWLILNITCMKNLYCLYIYTYFLRFCGILCFFVLFLFFLSLHTIYYRLRVLITNFVPTDSFQ